MDIIEILDTLVNDLGMTRIDIANAVGAHQSTISRLMSGEQDPGKATYDVIRGIEILAIEAGLFEIKGYFVIKTDLLRQKSNGSTEERPG